MQSRSLIDKRRTMHHHQLVEYLLVHVAQTLILLSLSSSHSKQPWASSCSKQPWEKGRDRGRGGLVTAIWRGKVDPARVSDSPPGATVARWGGCAARGRRMMRRWKRAPRNTGSGEEGEPQLNRVVEGTVWRLGAAMQCVGDRVDTLHSGPLLPPRQHGVECRHRRET